MSKAALKICVIILTLLGLPMIGVVSTGASVSRRLQFPPKTVYIKHAPFSWPVFSGLAIFIILVCLPFIYRIAWTVIQRPISQKTMRPFPWWGWFSLIILIAAWITAWNRFSWFAVLQPYTFPMLWLPFIIVLNALKFQKTGRCLLINRTGFLLWLFPLSAAFWWFFEYLNRFVQNWRYLGVTHDPWLYFWLATLSFSTVLPAVASMSDWLLSFNWMDKGFARFVSIKAPYPRFTAITLFIISGVGLFCIGIYPNYLFPLLWISPLLIIFTLQIVLGGRHLFHELIDGDWRLVVSFALAALICGFFWELWNLYSYSKWIYSVPFVYKFKIFEMPILGFSGYLPFGLECAVISSFLTSKITSE